MVFHIAYRTDWELAQAAQEYRIESLEIEGFIHCSTRDQVIRVANFLFKGKNDLLLLEIDESLVDVPIKYEGEAEELFPHIYGVLKTNAVVNVVPFPVSENGTFIFPQVVRFTAVGSEDRESLFLKYKSAFFKLIEDSFGWDEKFQRERFESRYEQDWFRWIEANDQCVGYVCYWTSATELHVALLVIDEDMRGRGYGNQVMQRLHREALKQLLKIKLSSFRKNAAAVKFYKKLGYVTTGEDDHFLDMELCYLLVDDRV
jgi:uncharacterized protein (DUF952 family)/GNAT superfamily N-acetyltransferase